jgi:hypothetical protein
MFLIHFHTIQPRNKVLDLQQQQKISVRVYSLMIYLHEIATIHACDNGGEHPGEEATPIYNKTLSQTFIK